MGVNVSNDIFPESTRHIHPPNLMHMPREGLYQSFFKIIVKIQT